MLMHATQGHPLPHPHLKDEKPAESGKRKGMLTAFPRTDPQETWLRGAWPTDKNGVVQFTSTFFTYGLVPLRLIF
jgi:hypothetical protein